MQDKLSLIYNNILEAIKKADKPAFAVFDFDNTCIANDISEATLRYMACHDLFIGRNILGEKIINPRSEDYSKAIFNKYFKLIDSGNTKQAYEFLPKILNDYSENKVSALVKQIMRSEGDKTSEIIFWERKVTKGISVRNNVIEIMNFLKNNGVEIWVVSASPKILVREAMKKLGIEANLIGIDILMSEDKFSGEIKTPTPIFDGKIDCIKRFIDQNKKPLLGVGDSMNDLPMLEYCDIKMVVNRQNSLTNKAKQNNWILI